MKPRLVLYDFWAWGPYITRFYKEQLIIKLFCWHAVYENYWILLCNVLCDGTSLEALLFLSSSFVRNREDVHRFTSLKLLSGPCYLSRFVQCIGDVYDPLRHRLVLDGQSVSNKLTTVGYYVPASRGHHHVRLIKLKSIMHWCLGAFGYVHSINTPDKSSRVPYQSLRRYTCFCLNIKSTVLDYSRRDYSSRF